MRTVLALVALSSLVACNPSKEEFAAQMAEVSCAKLKECFGEVALAGLGGSVEACTTSVTAEGTTFVNDASTCPDYDGAKAAACLDAYETVTCDAYENEDGLSACDEVCGAGTAR